MGYTHAGRPTPESPLPSPNYAIASIKILSGPDSNARNIWCIVLTVDNESNQQNMGMAEGPQPATSIKAQLDHILDLAHSHGGAITKFKLQPSTFGELVIELRRKMPSGITVTLTSRGQCLQYRGVTISREERLPYTPVEYRAKLTLPSKPSPGYADFSKDYDAPSTPREKYAELREMVAAEMRALLEARPFPFLSFLSPGQFEKTAEVTKVSGTKAKPVETKTEALLADARGRAAALWCRPGTQHLDMVPALAEEIAHDLMQTDDLLSTAWGLIANANGGDWDKASYEWRRAANQWRDEWQRYHTPKGPATVGLTGTDTP